MARILTFLITFSIISLAFAQEAIGVHEIKKGETPNEYFVKTTITGLEGVDIARASYKIEDVHTYRKVAENQLFTSRNKDFVKFYVMAVPESGVVIIEMNLTLSDHGAYSFPVEFQYARNDEKKIVHFPELVFKGQELLADEDAKNVNEIYNITEDKEVGSMIESSLASPTTTHGSIGSIKNEVVDSALVKMDEVEKETTIKEELTDTKVVYTIQLLSLSKFSQARLDDYCDKHSLLEEEISTRLVNGMTKVIYGKANSLEEAKKLIDRLKLLNNIDGAFAVPL